MRGGGEQQHVCRAGTECLGGLEAIAVVCDVVGLVDDHDIPSARISGPQHVGALHIVDRRNRHTRRRPRVDTGRQQRDVAPHARGVDDCRVDTKPVRQLVGPLLAHARRGENQHAIGPVAGAKLSDNQARLNGFSQADIVGEQKTGAEAAQDGERRLQLMRQQVHARGASAAQTARRRIRGQQRPTPATPFPRTDGANPARRLRRIDRFEGRNHSALSAVQAGERHELTPLVPAARRRCANVRGGHVPDRQASISASRVGRSRCRTRDAIGRARQNPAVYAVGADDGCGVRKRNAMTESRRDASAAGAR